MSKFSDDTFDRLKHYVSVRLQQGVPLLDADWNEMEDIRRFEIQAFLKWFVGDGVAYGNDGFAISPHIFKIEGVYRTVPHDFMIEAGRCLVSGHEAINDGFFMRGADGKWELRNQQAIPYQEQRLVKEDKLCDTWGVEPVEVFKFPATTSTERRFDLIYLDVWERMVDENEDEELLNKTINMPTCKRIKCEWVVRVKQGILEEPEAFLKELRSKSDPQHKDHGYYGLATIGWHMPRADGYIVPGPVITDLRRTGVNLARLADEIADARGMKATLGNRLDESLTKGGQLRQHVVGNEQVKDDAAIEEKKIKFDKDNSHHHKIRNYYPLMSIFPVEGSGLSQFTDIRSGICTILNKLCIGWAPIRLMPGCKMLQIIGYAQVKASTIPQTISVTLCRRVFAEPTRGEIPSSTTTPEVNNHLKKWTKDYQEFILEGHEYWVEISSSYIPKNGDEVLSIYDIGIIYEYES